MAAMIQLSMYGFTVNLVPAQGAAQVQAPEGESRDFRMTDYPEADVLADAKDYNPILADWIETLDTKLREQGVKASPTELLQHLRLHALVLGEEATVTLSAVPVEMKGETGRPTQVQRGTVMSYGIDMGGAQSIRETDHAPVLGEGACGAVGCDTM